MYVDEQPRYAQQGYPMQGYPGDECMVEEGMPPLGMEEQGMGEPIYPNRDQGFLQWLFSFRKEAITPLRHVWRGHEYNFEQNKWLSSKSKLRVMNEDGITWGISLIESYMSPVYITSDFDKKSYNFTMRQCARVVWNSLCQRYIEFGMKKSDIPRVAEEIESKVRAILLGALDNGYRDFFSTQNQNIETKNLTPQPTQQRPGVFASMANMFRRIEGEGNGGGGYGR